MRRVNSRAYGRGNESSRRPIIIDDCEQTTLCSSGATHADRMLVAARGASRSLVATPLPIVLRPRDVDSATLLRAVSTPARGEEVDEPPSAEDSAEDEENRTQAEEGYDERLAPPPPRSTGWLRQTAVPLLCATSTLLGASLWSYEESSGHAWPSPAQAAAPARPQEPQPARAARPAPPPPPSSTAAAVASQRAPAASMTSATPERAETAPRRARRRRHPAVAQSPAPAAPATQQSSLETDLAAMLAH